jgi:hypothetical protein
MNMLKLFLKYGVASLFGVTRYLHTEVERLQLRVWQLENRLDEVNRPQYEPSGYDDLDQESNLDGGWFDQVAELEPDGKKTTVARDEIFGRVVKPKNIRRTVDDLMREAKAVHNAQFTQQRELQEALEQQRIVEEMVAQDDEELGNETPVEVQISDAKKNFLIEAGRSIMQTSE